MKRFRLLAAWRLATVAVCFLLVTLLSAASVWTTALSVGERALGRVIRTVAAPSFGFGGAPSPAPSIGVTMAGTIATDTDADGKADPGDVVRYTTTITNSGPDPATGVQFTAIADAKTTLVPGSTVISPLAINETYPSVGNMTLTTASIGSDCDTPLRSVTCNDTLRGATLTGFGNAQGTAAGTVPNGTNTVTTTNNGTVRLNADGTFVYDPAAGFEGTDSFWYTLSNTTVTPALTDTAQVSIAVGGANGMVWFVNSTGGVGTGRQSNPFNSLAAINAVNNGTGTNPATGDTIYLLENATPHTGPLVLLNSQRLLGQDAIAGAITVATLGGPAPQAGNAYAADGGQGVSITSAAAGVNTIGLGSGNTLAGFAVGHTNGAYAIFGTVAGTVSVRQVTINSAGGGGLAISASGSFVNDATFTGFTSITATGGTNGIVLGGLTGTFTVGGALSGATGHEFIVNGGNATITYSGTITHNTAGQRAVAISDTTGGSVTLNNGGANAYVSGGTGILIDGAAGSVTIGNADLNGTKGIEILGDAANNATGTFTFNNVTIDTTAGATNHGFIVNGDVSGAGGNDVTGTIDLNNVDITNSGGNLVNIAGLGGGSIDFDSASALSRSSAGLGIVATSNAGGTITFNSSTKTLNTGGNNAVDLTSNTGTTINFVNGNLDVDTTTGVGFNATGGGTVTVQGSNNSINSTTGTALNVVSTGIGASGLTFVSISANGGANGIVLNGTGTTAGTNGGLTVTGVLTTDGTGGTIQSTTTRGASFISARDVTLKNMNFTNAATADAVATNTGLSLGTNLSENAAIHLQSVTNVVLDNLNINGSAEEGINGHNVNGFTLTNSALSGLGNGPDEDGLHFYNMVGTCAITNTSITGSGDDNINIQNNNNLPGDLPQTTSTTLTITGGSANAGVLGSGYLMGIRGTMNTTVTLSGVTADNNFSGGIVIDTFDTATSKIEVTNSTSTNNNDAISISAKDGNTSFDIHDNLSFAGTDFGVINVLKAAFSTTGTFQGKIRNNPIVVADGRPADGISLFNAGAGSLIVGITNNTINYRGTQRAINIQGGQDGAANLAVTVTGNAIDMQLDGTNNAVTGILAQVAVASPSGDGSAMCADIGGAGSLANVFTHSLGGTMAAGDLRIRQRFDTGVSLPGYAGGASDTTAVVNYLAARNTLVNSPAATATTGIGVDPGADGYSNAGASCTQPVFASLAPEIGLDRAVAVNDVGTASADFWRTRLAKAMTSVRATGVRSTHALSAGAAMLVDAERIARISAATMISRGWHGARSRAVAAAVSGQTLIDTAATIARGVRALTEQAANSLVASVYASGETIDATLGTLPAGKSITVVFTVTVETPPVASYSTHATISSTTASFATVDSNTVTTPGDRYNTTTAIVSSLNPADQGTAVTFTATVTATEGPSTAPDGTVQFKDGGINIGSPVTCTDAGGPNCSAQLTTSSLPSGTRSITAEYLGGTNHDPSVTSTPVSQVIVACTTNPVVTVGADSGAGSLREAMTSACSGNTITFQAGLTLVTLTSAELTATRNVTISGPGAAGLTVTRDAGAGAFRIFHFTAGQTIAITGLTITNGAATGAGLDSYGGAIFAEQAALTLRGVAIRNNTAGTGGGILSRAASAAGNLTIADSTISGNTATVDQGGGVMSFGLGGGVATLTVVNSTISGNSAALTGGGVDAGSDSTATLTNVTITDNRALATPPRAGGLGATGTVVLRNSLIARNYLGASPSTTAADVLGALDASSSNNLIGDGTNMIGVAHGVNGNQVGTAGSPIDPRLGPLASNGGPTQTHTLLNGSPAIDAGDDTFVVSPPFTVATPITDQRGTGFTRILDGADANTTATVDLGALEANVAVEDITAKTTAEDTLLSFSFNVGDGLTAFDSIVATTSDPAVVTNAGLSVTGSGSTRTLGITPTLNASGTATVTVTATRTIAGVPQTASDTFLLTVTALDDLPTLDAIADPVAINEDGSALPVNLTGISAGGGESQTLTVTATSDNPALIPNPTVTYTSPNPTGSLDYTPVPNASGSAVITVTVTDAGSQVFSRAFSVTVNAIADTPSVSNATTNEDTQSSSGLVVSRHAADGAEVTHVQVTGITNGTLFLNDGTTSVANGSFITFAQANAGLRLTPAANFFGAAGFSVQASTSASVPGLGGAVVTATITVNPVADTPSVTNASTLANVQTTAGLVLSRNGADGPEVTHFKITGITGGTLYQNDGTTVISDGNFITFAQANAGLRFTPTLGSSTTGHVSAQASLSASDAGLGGAVVTADIVITTHSTATTIVSANPNPSDRLQAVPVVYTVISTTGGPTPTGDVVVTISGGPETCTGTVAAGSCSITLTEPAVDRIIKATYVGDAVSSNSFGTLLHTVLPCPIAPIVTTTADSGVGSLRQAIADACATDSITFAIPGAGPHTIALTAGSIPLTKNLTITGSGGGIRIAGTGVNNLFSVTPGATVSLSALTLMNGGGGAITNDGTLTVTDSTLSGNANQLTEGGAIRSAGTLVAMNTTFSGNSSGATGGALYLDAGSVTTLTNVTITANAAVLNAGGIRNLGTLTIENSIVAGNTAAIPGPDLDDIGGGITNDGGHNVLSGDPKLGPLTNNGGPTFTHALLPGSPALDAGDNAAATAAGLTTDQRGVARVVDSADADTTATVDIGAFEAQVTLAAIGPQTVPEDGSVQIAIAQSGLVVTATSATPAIVPDDATHLALTGSGTSRTLTVTPAPNAFGTATITVTVTAGTESASQSFTVTVTPIADVPSVTSASTVEDTQTTSGLVISANPVDAGSVAGYRISGITGGTLFQQDGTTPIAPGAVITVAQGNAGLRFTPAPNTFGAGSIVVQAAASLAGDGLSVPVTRTISVAAVADTPSITGASTSANEQTTSGLVVARNAADGAEVTHIKIISVANGTLFQNDGTSPVAAGSFITIAQGAAGLRFTPAADSIATGQVTIRASIDASDAGLGGGTATADITVGKLTSTTALTTSLTPSAPGQTVTFTATVTPVAAATGGTVQFRDGTTALGSPVALNGGVATFTTATLLPGVHNVIAEFSGSAVYLGSTGTVEQLVTSGRTLTIGAGAGAVPHVRQFGGLDGSPATGPLSSFFAFPTGFSGGVRVAEGDINGDGVADVISGAGVGAPSQVVIHSGATGGVLSSFFAYDPSFTGGVYVAAGDIDGDGRADVITGAGGGAAPHVRVFSGATGAPIASFFATDAAFSGGVRVAAGDIDGDGRADIVTGAGPGATGHVRVFSGATFTELMTFDAYPGFMGGIYVAAGDVNGDGYADVITGAGEGGGAHVRAFDGRSGATLTAFFAEAPPFAGGVRVAAGDVNGDGRADIITALGPGGDAQVRVFDGTSGAVLNSFNAFDGFAGGIFVATAAPESRAVIDAPTSGSTVRENFRIQGWAIQENAAGGTGVDAIHIWAYPVAGGAPILLGGAVLGDARPDVAAIFGDVYLNSGYHLDVTGLAEGTYDIHVFVHDASTGRFDTVRSTQVTVRLPVNDVRMHVDLPRADATVSGTFRIAGWALETSGLPIEAVHIWVESPGAVVPKFLGPASLGDARPDVAAAFGPSFGTTGFHLDVTGLADGPHTLLVFPKVLGAPAFAAAQVVRITVGTPAPVVLAGIDLPATGETPGSFRLSGWALTLDAPTAPAIDAIQVWALPIGGGAPRFLGAPALGGRRPDKAAIYGAQYDASGFNVIVEDLPAGTWDLVVSIRPAGATTFTTSKVVRVTVQ